MTIKKFNKDNDYEKVILFLTNCYKENNNMVCWLPARFDDLIFRIDTLYYDERGLEKSSDYIYIFEENDEIIGLVIPDGDSFNSCIKAGYESIFSKMLDLSEKELLKRGYQKDVAEDYDNVQHPLETDYKLTLPKGFKQVYGDDLDDNMKAKTCHYGFHPSDDDGILTGSFREGALAYQSRKKSKYFNDSFESLIVTDDGDICSYCFCYVDKNTNTAFIEPVCTREKYRKLGLSKQMPYRVIIRLKEMNIKSVYINSYDWRKKVYNSVGFQTEDSIGFWHKKI